MKIKLTTPSEVIGSYPEDSHPVTYDQAVETLDLLGQCGPADEYLSERPTQDVLIRNYANGYWERFEIVD